MISMIAAMGKNRVIGNNNSLLWYIPEDYRWFKENTINKPVVMGRKTYESIGSPLKNRDNIIITNNKQYNVSSDSVKIYNNVEKILEDYGNNKELMIIGGQQTYNQFIQYSSRIYLTIIDINVNGDAFFPQLDSSWVIKYQREGKDKSSLKYSFNIFERQ